MLAKLNSAARTAALTVDDLVARVEEAASAQQPSTEQLRRLAIDYELAAMELDATAWDLQRARIRARSGVPASRAGSRAAARAP